MTRRRLSWLVGGGLALLAVFAVLTTAPLVTGVPRSDAKVMTSDASESDSVTCATIEFAVTFHYSVTTPVLDLWGFRTVHDVTIDPAQIDIDRGPTCSGPVRDLGGAAYIQTAQCPVDVIEPVMQAAATTNMGATCDNTLLYYSVLSEGPAQSATHSYFGPQSVAPSGFGRGTWCLTYSSEARYSKVSSSVVATGSTTNGDLCLDLS